MVATQFASPDDDLFNEASLKESIAEASSDDDEAEKDEVEAFTIVLAEIAWPEWPKVSLLKRTNFNKLIKPPDRTNELIWDHLNGLPLRDARSCSRRALMASRLRSTLSSFSSRRFSGGAAAAAAGRLRISALGDGNLGSWARAPEASSGSRASAKRAKAASATSVASRSDASSAAPPPSRAAQAAQLALEGRAAQGLPAESWAAELRDAEQRLSRAPSAAPPAARPVALAPPRLGPGRGPRLTRAAASSSSCDRRVLPRGGGGGRGRATPREERRPRGAPPVATSLDLALGPALGRVTRALGLRRRG